MTQPLTEEQLNQLLMMQALEQPKREYHKTEMDKRPLLRRKLDKYVDGIDDVEEGISNVVAKLPTMSMTNAPQEIL